MPPLKLYVKVWCPWCVLAERRLRELDVDYEQIDVERDPAAFREMKVLSGQARTPTLVEGDRVLADFGPEELEPFLAGSGVAP